MLVWYLKKEFVDTEPAIEAVTLHYTWSPIGKPADWSAIHESRPMERAGPLIEGLGKSFRVLEGGMVVHGPDAARIVSGDPDSPVRKKITKLPRHVQEPATGEWVPHYLLHYYFEVFQDGERKTSDLFTEEIVSKELVYTDWEGMLCGTCIYWGVGDWDAPVFSPTEDPRFIERWGEDHEFRSIRLYHHPDQAKWHREKYRMMQEFALPWRWTGRIYGPRGAVVLQKWHIANLALPPGQAWEDWVGETSHVLY